MYDIIAEIVCVCAWVAAWENSARRSKLTIELVSRPFFDLDLHLVVHVIYLIFVYLERLIFGWINCSSADERDAAFGPHNMHLIVFMMKNFASLTSFLIWCLSLFFGYLEAFNLKQGTLTSRISALIFILWLFVCVIILDNLVEPLSRTCIVWQIWRLILGYHGAYD